MWQVSWLAFLLKTFPFAEANSGVAVQQVQTMFRRHTVAGTAQAYEKLIT